MSDYVSFQITLESVVGTNQYWPMTYYTLDNSNNCTCMWLLSGLSGDVIINELGDRMPAFFAYDLRPNGHFAHVVKLQIIINDVTNQIEMVGIVDKGS